MGKVYTEKQNFQDIANAIRNKTGTQDTMSPSQMANKINGIPSSYPPKWSDLGYDNTPQSIIDGFNYGKQIAQNWDPATTNAIDMFRSDMKLKFFPLIDTSNLTLAYRMFQYSNLESLPSIDTSKITNLRETFNGCASLVEIKPIDTSSVTDIRNAFNSCTMLQKVPVLNLSSITVAINSFFGGCPMLTDESLNNILASLLTATSYTGTKTLSIIGLSATQATTCTTLSNWTELDQKGWTTGY